MKMNPNSLLAADAFYHAYSTEAANDLKDFLRKNPAINPFPVILTLLFVPSENARKDNLVRSFLRLTKNMTRLQTSEIVADVRGLEEVGFLPENLVELSRAIRDFPPIAYGFDLPTGYNPAISLLFRLRNPQGSVSSLEEAIRSSGLFKSAKDYDNMLTKMLVRQEDKDGEEIIDSVLKYSPLLLKYGASPEVLVAELLLFFSRDDEGEYYLIASSRLEKFLRDLVSSLNMKKLERELERGKIDLNQTVNPEVRLMQYIREEMAYRNQALVNAREAIGEMESKLDQPLKYLLGKYVL
jgi:hypothetical protein